VLVERAAIREEKHYAEKVGNKPNLDPWFSYAVRESISGKINNKGIMEKNVRSCGGESLTTRLTF